MLSDIRYALRTLRVRPGFAATIVATLALGIGASTAMFSIVDAALLRGLPFDDPHRLVVLWGVAGPDRDIRGASIPEARDWAADNRSLSALTVYDETALNLRTSDGATRVEAEMVSPSFFPLLGARAALGRTFIADEDRTPETHPVAVISDQLWRERFAADPAVIGRPVVLNERSLTIIGVMPPGFKGLSFDTDIWFPAMMVSLTVGADALESRASRWLMALGRLQPGREIADAQRDLDRVAERLTREFPQTNTGRGVRVLSLRDSYLGTTRTLLVLLFAAVIVFLLIACANVTGLQLVHATARQRELAVRLALGADRRRLVRQLLTESVLLSILGGAAGALVAYWAVDALRPFIPVGLLPGYADVTVNGRVLGFSLVLALGAGATCGLAPALLSARQELAQTLRDGSRLASASGLGRISRPGTHQIIVTVEVALALVLLVAAGLMVRTFQSQLRVSPGFAADGVLTARLALPASYAPEQRALFAARLAERLGAIPGAAVGAVGSDVPMSGNTSAASFALPGLAERVRYYRHYVTPEYFPTLGIAMARGRAFTAGDRRGAMPVAILSESGANRLFPGADPIGRTLPIASGAFTDVTIVGVARDVRFRDLTTDIAAARAEPDIYFPYGQRTDADIQIAVRSTTEALVSPEAVRQAIAALDATLPLYQVTPLSEALRRQTATSRFGSLMLGVFSVVALLLASIGLYGVIAFVVGLSRREIAIRMALGAEAAVVRRLVVRNAAVLIVVGIVAGIGAAMLVMGSLEGLLFSVSPRDPLTFVTVAATVLVVALLASWVPARRAAQVEPQLALKSE